MNLDQWYAGMEGKRLDSFTIKLTKTYRDPVTECITDHNIEYTIPVLDSEALVEILFSDVQHDVDKMAARLRYKVESRFRRTVQNLDNNVKYL